MATEGRRWYSNVSFSRDAMVKVVARQVHAVALPVVLAVPATAGRLENNDAATETQKVSQRAEGS